MIFRSFRLAPLLAMLWLLTTAAAALADKPPRYVALLSNGERIEGNELKSWHNNGAQPQINGKQLLDSNRMMRWQRDRTLLPGPLPRAFVEFHTGDRLPGSVLDYVSPESSRFDPQDAHLRVRLEYQYRPPERERVRRGERNREGDLTDPTIRVVTSHIRRIVWQKRDRNDFEPNTVFYRDGRSLPFRAARFGPGFVNLLLAEGNRRVAFAEMAEIHLAAANPWQAYFDELAGLDLRDEQARLYQIETTDGLVITGSYEQRQISGEENRPDRWIHALQPAWSLDMIPVPAVEVVARRMWLPHEVPLSRIAFASVVTRSPLSTTGRAPRVNTNVEGGSLRSGTLDFGWGFGVHAHTELAFDLPAGAKSLRGQVALDRIAGKGGCVRARVFANNITSAPLWESPILVGSDTVADLGSINLAGQKSLVLQVDAQHAGRPAGADPLDVRDTADWLDPWIELDQDFIKREVAQRSHRQFAAWHDWTVTLPSDNKQVLSRAYWSETIGTPASWRPSIAVREKPLVLSRDLKLSPNDHWLVVFATRGGYGGALPKLEVRIGGEPVAEYEVPQRMRGNQDQPPLAVRLTNYQASQKPIHIEIRQLPTNDLSFIDYRAIEIVPQLPHLYQVFEDQGVFSAIDAEQKGGAKLFADDRHYGAHSVQVTADGKFRLKLPETLAIREQPKWGEYRLVRFAFRKVGKGRVGIEFNRDAEPDRPAAYDAGAGNPVTKDAKRVWNDNLPNHWIVMTRDLYGDFGAFDTNTLTLQSPDGEFALLDHVYFARRNEDFNLIPNAPPPEVVNQLARRALAKPVIERGLPATVTIQTKDGRIASGICVSREGEILTVGHLLTTPNEECTVSFADGKTLKAQSRGVWRDFDFGMVKITDKGEYPFVERTTARELPENDLYVGFTHASKFEKGKAPTTSILTLRQVFRGMIWADLEVEDFSAGGPLLNREGKVVGILTRRHEFGGFLFSRIDDFENHWNRLRNGEVYGQWYPGLGPMFGFTVLPTREGAKLSDVFDKSPAALAGLKQGDIVTKVDGRSVVSLADIYSILAEKNPGQQCTLDYFRDGEMRQAKLTLAPRVP